MYTQMPILILHHQRTAHGASLLGEYEKLSLLSSSLALFLLVFLCLASESQGRAVADICHRRIDRCSFWVAASLDPAFFSLGSSLIPLGLSVPQALGTFTSFRDGTPLSLSAMGSLAVLLTLETTFAGIIVLGNVIVSIPIVANGAVGSYMRVPFPVAIRASMGYYFSYLAVVSRLFLALIWFGVETYNGGLAMTQFLYAIWPSTSPSLCSIKSCYDTDDVVALLFRPFPFLPPLPPLPLLPASIDCSLSGYIDIPNRLPESAGISTADMTSYFLFWLIQLPFFFINSNHLKYAFMLKVFVVPATAIAMTVSIAKDAGGSGPLVRAPATVFGSDFSYAMLTGLGAVIGNWSTLALNSPGKSLPLSSLLKRS